MGKMRIGILTHPLRDNYGGILQAWAMQAILKRRGAEVETFAMTFSKQSRFELMLIQIKRAILKLIGKCDIPVFYEQKMQHVNQHFIRFIRDNITLRKIRSAKEIPSNEYDAIAVGSDQVWRDIFRGLCLTDDRADAFLYSLDDNCMRFSYAASIGIDTWTFTTDETKRIRKALQRFKAVSVRELSGVPLLLENADCKAEWVLDPTMLLTREDYRRLVKVNGGVNGTYKGKIVSYILDATEDKDKLINMVVSAKHGEHLELKISDENAVRTSIQEWITAIDDAKIVITDSFHGCVFSIIFGKPLIFIMNEERGNARFDSLIKKFGIDNNLVNTPDDFDPNKDYSLPKDINDKLSLYRKISNDFLDKALN